MQELSEHLFNVRGLHTEEDRKNFLKPDFYLHSHDPFLLSGMEDVVARIRAAKEKGETIGIYTDYDCDGIPGAVVLSDFLKKIGVAHVVYIPDRQLDGYGLTVKGIDYLLERGTHLIITIDLGITGFEGATYLKEKNIDLIVTDHHMPHEELPDVFAIVNPKRINDEYPFKELCGTGVIFKIVQGYLERFRKEDGIEAGWEKWLLDMVGLATLSDMVALVGENRVFAYYGLVVMRKTKRSGLLALYTQAGLKAAQLCEEDVTHGITPRLNAASRMGDAYLAYEVLKATDPVEGSRLAKELESLNKKRKAHVAEIMKEVHHLPKTIFERGVIVLGNPKWRPGVLGLVATKVLELYQKPTFVWGGSDEENIDIVKGSCRGTKGMSVVSLMETAAETFDHYGGHVGAGGFAISKRAVHDLAAVLEAGLALATTTEADTPDSSVKHFTLSQPKKDAFAVIEQFAPFGVSNERPIFRSEFVTLVSHKLFGKTKEHLEVIFSIGGREYKAIAFFTTDVNFTRPLIVGDSYTLIYTLEMSYFIRPELRLKIIDIF